MMMRCAPLVLPAAAFLLGTFKSRRLGLRACLPIGALGIRLYPALGSAPPTVPFLPMLVPGREKSLTGILTGYQILERPPYGLPILFVTLADANAILCVLAGIRVGVRLVGDLPAHAEVAQRLANAQAIAFIIEIICIDADQASIICRSVRIRLHRRHFGAAAQ